MVTSSQCHSTMWCAKHSDSPCHSLTKTTASDQRRWMSIENTRSVSLGMLKITSHGSSNQRQPNSLWMLERQHLHSTRSIIDQISLWLVLQYTRSVQKRQLCISTRSSASALRINYSTLMSQLTYQFCSILIQLLIMIQTLEMKERFYWHTISSQVLTKQWQKYYSRR